MKTALAIMLLLVAASAQAALINVGQQNSFDDNLVPPPADFTFTLTTERGTATWTVEDINHYFEDSGQQVFSATEANPNGADIDAWKALFPATGMAQSTVTFGSHMSQRDHNLDDRFNNFDFVALGLAVYWYGEPPPPGNRESTACLFSGMTVGRSPSRRLGCSFQLPP